MLELRALTKVFRTKAAEVRAVDDVSLVVERGEIVSLLGPSGCGKTTTLRLIAGFETATAGVIELAGRDVSRLPPQKRETGMVFQNYALFPHMDVFENVAFGLRSRGDSASDIERRVTRALELVDLSGYGTRRVQELSGGQQQRVAVARALAPEPPLLLLDEPLSNLDSALRERTRAELRGLLKQLGMTAVFVTHDQDEAFAMADRIALLNLGRLQQYATADDLYSRPANPFVAGFIGRANFIEAPVAVVNASDDTVIHVRITDTIQWAATAANGFRAQAGERVRVMIRPESLAAVRADDDALSAVVRERRFAGAFTAAVLDTDCGELVMHSREFLQTPGSRIRIAPVGSVLAFPLRP
ncbi:ABC transporter ATP-binding protein [soil metagenome]